METLPSSWAWYIIIVTAAVMFALSYWIYNRTHVASGETFMVASRGVSWGLIMMCRPTCEGVSGKGIDVHTG